MENVVEVASYICTRYKNQFGEPIDEMKLHKLLYFCQRESIIQFDEPMFTAEFEAWMYGPVIVSIRKLYKDNMLNSQLSMDSIERYKSVFDKVFEVYAVKDSWSLSTLTHGEYSWRKARGVLDGASTSNGRISINDIRKDAERIKMRRFFIEQANALDIKQI